MADLQRALEQAHRHALRWLESLPERRVNASASAEQLLVAFDEPLPETPADPAAVVDLLARTAEPGLVASPAGRFFGFVVGGAVPAALAADWLTAAWDQNAGLAMAAPAEAAVEKVAAGWLLDLLGLPSDASVGFATGGCMANFTCLAAARHRVLAKAGWDVEADGLQGAPEVTVVASEDRHVTVDVALRYLGFGSRRVVVVGADEQGRVRPEGLAAALRDVDGPVIVCLQAGNVNTGACDPFAECVDAAKGRDAWVHVDGAFGLWAGAATSTRHLVAGVAGADSWATDAHKWLNVPYDCGLAIVADRAAQAGSMGVRASYLVQGGGPVPDQLDLVPEFSRRGRGFPVWAALRSLGRQGVADLVERCCAHARRFADGLAEVPGARVLNDVVLNQVLVRFGDDDEVTRKVVRRILADGTAFMTGTTYRGRAAMRISVSNWSTTSEDVDRSLEALHRCVAAPPRPLPR
jgi:glutamate/tyrosine decarboxylase-like PLP-dependent enzyme